MNDRVSAIAEHFGDSVQPFPGRFKRHVGPPNKGRTRDTVDTGRGIHGVEELGNRTRTRDTYGLNTAGWCKPVLFPNRRLIP